jgi:hypothetical protein
MCNNRSHFISYKRLPFPITTKLGDDTTVTATYHGLAHITQDLQLDALYTPTFQLSLLSISQLEHAGYTTTFRHEKRFISTDTNSTASIITANCIGNLYISNHQMLLPPRPYPPKWSSSQKPQPPPERRVRKRNNCRQLRRLPISLQHLQSLQDCGTED